MSFEVLIREAETGFSMARQGGGDRCVQWLEVESELDRLREELEEQMREVERRGELFAQEQDALAESRSKEFVKRIKEVFSREKQEESVDAAREGDDRPRRCAQIEEWRDGTLARELTDSRKPGRQPRAPRPQAHRPAQRHRDRAQARGGDEERRNRHRVDLPHGARHRRRRRQRRGKAKMMKCIFEANLALLGRNASEQQQ
jgi:hypothetical protein